MTHTARSHSHTTRGVALAAFLLTVAACGSSGGTYGSSSSTPTRSSSSTSTSQGLKVASTSLGKVVVDGHGMTVYLLTSDKPGSSLCPSACLQFWPPVPAPAAGAKHAGLTATVGSTADTAGKQMATVGGWPVYTFVKDQAPGDVNGEGVKSFGGTWWAVSPAGKPVTGAGAKSSGYNY